MVLVSDLADHCCSILTKAIHKVNAGGGDPARLSDVAGDEVDNRVGLGLLSCRRDVAAWGQSPRGYQKTRFELTNGSSENTAGQSTDS